MLEKFSNIWKPMNRLKVTIFLLTTNLSWWLMKQKNINRFNGFSIYLI
jgi:hypothetical protein